MANFFNSIPLRKQRELLATCRFMDKAEFSTGCDSLKGKKIVVVGCGAQGLHQGLNLRDSGLDVSYALRKEAITEKRQSWKSATENGFKVGTYEELIPTADLVANLTPDKQHTSVVTAVMPLMKKDSCLLYSHGFNIVEEGMQVRKDITVIMVAPKSPGTEVRNEYKRGFGVPTLIAVHTENDPQGRGLELAKAYCSGTGGDRAGVLLSSFVAEVKSDLLGEQTILCGLLQTGSILCYERMVAGGIEASYASRFIQYGWETITEALKIGGITNMFDRLSNPAKIKAFEISEELKKTMRPLFEKHMDDIISGAFSEGMMKDWADGDRKLLTWREETSKTAFERQEAGDHKITEQEFFDKGVLMIAMVRAGVELAFDVMTEAGMKDESAYYESLHETPLIANLIARKKLYEMNKVISDTAEYGCYLFSHAAVPLLKDYVAKADLALVGKIYGEGLGNSVSNRRLVEVNAALRGHGVELVGTKLRGYMTAMKPIL